MKVKAMQIPKEAPMDLNVVVIISDQHKRSAMGASGNRIVKTPHLDALAADGVSFTHAYAPSPLCAPSRAAFITSTLPCQNTAAYHVYNMDGEMTPSGLQRFPGYRAGLTTMGEYFRQHGYVTGAIGKMHVHGETRGNDMGFDVRKLRFYTYHYEDYERAVCDGDAELGLRRRLQYTSQGQEGCPHDYSWTGQYNNRDAERCPAVIETMDGSVMTEKDMLDVLTTEESLAFMDEHSERNFLLHVGLEKPHPPWTEVARFMSMYSADDIGDEDLPHAWNEAYRPFVMDWLKQGPGKEAVKTAQAAYYANVTSMDEKVGRIIQKLKDEGLYDKTLIVYTSDHGEMCYEHSQVEKHCMYEAAVNVPLIISCPALLPKGETREYAVSLIDILPTIGDLCGFEHVPSFRGESLKPVLLDPAQRNPDKVIYSEFTQVGYSQHPDGRNRRVPMRMVLTEQHKYVYTHKLPDQLYPVGSGEVYLLDDCSASHPEIVKVLKRYALAGWHNDGLVSRHSSDRDVEDLLGDNHLPVRLQREESHWVLSWKNPGEIWNWNAQTRSLEQTPVTRFAVYKSDTDEIHTAKAAEAIDADGRNEYRFRHISVDKAMHCWIVAESDDATLAASRSVALPPTQPRTIPSDCPYRVG